MSSLKNADILRQYGRHLQLAGTFGKEQLSFCDPIAVINEYHSQMFIAFNMSRHTSVTGQLLGQYSDRGERLISKFISSSFSAKKISSSYLLFHEENFRDWRLVFIGALGAIKRSYMPDRGCNLQNKQLLSMELSIYCGAHIFELLGSL